MNADSATAIASSYIVVLEETTTARAAAAVADEVQRFCGDRIDQRDLPLDDTYTYAASGAGFTAYVVDTGIHSGHSDFGERVSSGYDAVGDGNGTEDCQGHGTHVAGTIGGSSYGLAKDVALVAVRVLDCGGSGSTSGVIAGVDWVAANHSGPSVANMSLGGGASQSLDDAVAGAVSAGVAFAVAAGNDYGADACCCTTRRTGPADPASPARARTAAPA